MPNCISDKMFALTQKNSAVREMFEEGNRLAKLYGRENVYDFSLGNPNFPAPEKVKDAVFDALNTEPTTMVHGYMSNAGYPDTRAAIAESLNKRFGTAFSEANILMSVGAAGGLNVILKTLLNPGDEVLAFAPFFLEYGNYVRNYDGELKIVPPNLPSFQPDPAALEAAITEKTKAVIINSPNNPTGQIYSRDELAAVAALLTAKSRAAGRPIFLVADEPYRFLAYDGVEVPSLLSLYDFAVVASSFSKNMSMPGERVGYLALSPRMPERNVLINGLIYCNRVLGYVNPPVVGQHLMLAALGSQVDAGIYQRRRDAMAEVLSAAGYQFLMPKGAFYFFPKAPGGDDVAFADKLMRHLVLAVPGSGFGGPGHFRLAFCVDEAVIRRAADGLKKALHS